MTNLIDEVLADVPRLLTLRQAAEILNVHRNTVKKWVREDRIGYFRLKPGPSGHIRIPKAEIARVLGERG